MEGENMMRKKNKMFLLTLSALSLSFFQSDVFAEENSDSAEYQIVEFEKLTSENSYTYLLDEVMPKPKELEKIMPDSLVAITEKNESIDIPVEWYCDKEEYYDDTVYTIVFEPKFDMDVYNVEEECELPLFYVDVRAREKYKASTLNLTGNENEDTCYNFLHNSVSLNRASSCGVLGNLYIESSFNPLAYNSGENAWGICQWRGDRLSNLKSRYPNSWKTLDSQLNFLVDEFNGTDYSGPKTLSYLRGRADDSNGAQEAAQYFAQYFERCASSTYASRKSWAVKFYDDRKQNPTPIPTENPVDVGTDFYAYLINTATWLHATNDDSGNVSVRKLQYASNQTWYFERQGDGSYKITSCKDGRCMEVHNFESANGTNVEMNDWNGNTAQRWFVYGSSGEYKLKAACGSNALDMKGGPEGATDGTNLNMWEDNGTAAQKFQIWKLEPNLGTTEASIEKYGDADGNNVKISWNSCNDATGYDIRIFNESETEVVQTFWNVQGTSCLVKLESGTYHVKVYTLNSQFNIWKGGNASSFTCSNNLGTNFYAYLINTATWLHATNDNGNVNVKKLDYSPNQIWYFELQSDCSYKITSAEDDRCMEVHNFESADGTNVEMNSWSGNSAQRWFIYGASGSYKLKAACGNNALDMRGGPEAAQDGTNLNMWEDNGTDAQKFQIWKLDDIKDTIRNKTITLEYSECIYNGKECTPNVLLKKDSTELVKDTDYRVSYADNINAGTATVTIIGIGQYTGKITKEFRINKASQELTVSVDKTNISIGETVQIKADGQGQITCESSAEDKVTVSSTGMITGKQAGEAIITVTASGTQNYNSATEKLTINVQNHNWDANEPTLSLVEKNGILVTSVANTAHVTEYGFVYGKQTDVTLETPGRTRIVYSELDADGCYSLDAVELTGCMVRAYAVYTDENGRKQVAYSESIVR